ncbi:hypothetical protein PLESTM_000147800 [Pleodorina starrii]|nr:hypothetical protein PLESTM_000147800 [Pleodorina starrii]
MGVCAGEVLLISIWLLARLFRVRPDFGAACLGHWGVGCFGCQGVGVRSFGRATRDQVPEECLQLLLLLLLLLLLAIQRCAVVRERAADAEAQSFGGVGDRTAAHGLFSE